MSSILDTALAIVIVFLLFSLVVSTLNETILSLLDRRAYFLKICLKEILNTKTSYPPVPTRSTPFLRHVSVLTNWIGTPYKSLKQYFVFVRPQEDEDPDSAVNVTKFLQHGLVTSLSRGPYCPDNSKGQGIPSYIPTKIFSAAMFALLGDGSMGDLRLQIDKLPEGSRLQSSLLALHTDAKNDLERFRTSIEFWFDDSMARASGWYKRYAQKWMLLLSAVLAVTCNVDAIRIVREVSGNSTLRNELIKQINHLPAPANDPEPANGVPAVPSAVEELNNKAKSIQKSLDALGKAGIPIGWDDQTIAIFNPPGEATGNYEGGLVHAASINCVAAFSMVLGWLVTVFAVSLGAPFWFDLLNRFMNIRNAGPSPAEVDLQKNKPTNK